MELVVTAPAVLLADELVAPGWVAMDGGTVTGVGRGEPSASRTGARTIALPHGVLAPGLVDIQLNGAYGHDVADADLDGWLELVGTLPGTGVTSFVPTIITAPLSELTASLARYRGWRGTIDSNGGARTLGLHVEGPFLASGRHGAHREQLLCDPTPEAIRSLLDAGGSDLAYVTLAPERTGGQAAIAQLVRAGVRVSVGHSDATDAQVFAAADAGAQLVTHLYNAQRGFAHRDPGVVGAALVDQRLTIGLIVDLHHVASTAVRTAFAAASGRVALVTDAIAALGMPPGTYHLGGQRVTVRQDAPPVGDDGTIAGSVVRLDQAVGNAIGCGIAPAVALTAATRVPADALGRTDLGRLRVGAVADLVWLDEGWRAAATWVAGRVVHRDETRTDGVEV